MEVLSVTRQRGQVVVTLDAETLRIPAALYRERPLQPGDEVDLEEYDQWLLLMQYRPALEYAVSLLAQRPFAAGELQEKLTRRGYRPQVSEMVIYKLNRHGLLDDAAFAQQWAEARARRGLGQRRIAQELRRKGVSAEEADAALEEMDPSAWQEEAVRWTLRRLRSRVSDPDPRKTDQLLTAALVRRGYPYSDAREAVRAARDQLTSDREDPT